MSMKYKFYLLGVLLLAIFGYSLSFQPFSPIVSPVVTHNRIIVPSQDPKIIAYATFPAEVFINQSFTGYITIFNPTNTTFDVVGFSFMADMGPSPFVYTINESLPFTVLQNSTASFTVFCKVVVYNVYDGFATGYDAVIDTDNGKIYAHFVLLYKPEQYINLQWASNPVNAEQVTSLSISIRNYSNITAIALIDLYLEGPYTNMFQIRNGKPSGQVLKPWTGNNDQDSSLELILNIYIHPPPQNIGNNIDYSLFIVNNVSFIHLKTSFSLNYSLDSLNTSNVLNPLDNLLMSITNEDSFVLPLLLVVLVESVALGYLILRIRRAKSNNK